MTLCFQTTPRDSYIPVTGYLIAFVGSGPGKSFLLVFRQPVTSECMFIRRRGQ